eukprot:9642079-Lingulodinium_polyedra.AAC.1
MVFKKAGSFSKARTSSGTRRPLAGGDEAGRGHQLAQAFQPRRGQLDPLNVTLALRPQLPAQALQDRVAVVAAQRAFQSCACDAFVW